MSYFESNERILEFINEIHKHPTLWDVETIEYKDREAKKNIWVKIANKFNISSEEAYKKFKNLRTYAKNEERKKKCNNDGGKQVKWFAYDAISFILSRDRDITNSGVDNNISYTDTPEDENQTKNINNEDTREHSPVLPDRPQSVRKSSRKKFKHDEESTMTKVMEIMLESIKADIERRNDSCFCYGEYIAHRLKSYDEKTRALAQYKIGHVLFEMDMRMHNKENLTETTPNGHM